MLARAKNVPVASVAVTLELEPDEAHLLAHLVCGYEIMKEHGALPPKGCMTYTFTALEKFAKKVRGVLENAGVKPVV